MTSNIGGASPSVAAGVWFRLFWIGAALTLILVGSLVPHFSDSSELVRMRNALLLQSEPAEHAWTPASVPDGFALESASPLPVYKDAVIRNALRVEGDDWATALRIGQDLLRGGKRGGGPIMSDLETTYNRITRHGEGYCGDYADAFTALANVAGVFSRPWAFSFEGFAGRGHIFNEIWDSGSARWIMIDVFNNVYPVDASGRTLSAMEFRELMLSDPDGISLVPIHPETRPGFIHEHKAFDFYRRGLAEWYMWWGNNVFEYDQAALVQMLGSVHRAVEQFGGIVSGVHPGIRILETPQNEPQRKALWWLKARLIAVVATGALASIALCGWLWARRRTFARGGIA